MIKRAIEDSIRKKIGDKKAIIILGARQTGKTTLVKQVFESEKNVLWLNGDDMDVRAIFQSITSSRLKAIIGNNRYVVLDEAQRIENIGLKMKLITDQIPSTQLIVTGSSSLELADKLNEPLTGRKWEYSLFPLSFAELSMEHGLLEETRMIQQRLIFGSYPDVVQNQGSEREILSLLADSYLYKDILTLDQIKKSSKLTKLVQALAFQVGSQVSYSELGGLCELDAKTVEKYIRILEKAFIVFEVGSYSGNLRNELKFSKKIYFYDNGIRNALIGNYSPLETRTDIGALWENYLMSERSKMNAYTTSGSKMYFWRTTSQREIDLVENRDGVLSAYEFKWNPAARVRPPAAFLGAYPGSSFQTIHRENYWEYLTET